MSLHNPQLSANVLPCLVRKHSGGFKVLFQIADSYPVRGIKGAVGTQLDLATLMGGDANKISEFDRGVGEFLGLPATFGAVGQVYPRSLDFEVVSALFQVSSGPSSFARTLRLMAGHELASEGFAKGQVGSSAMPHKMNSRSSERINGFHMILRGHVSMASSLAGDQWNEEMSHALLFVVQFCLIVFLLLTVYWKLL